LIQLSFSGSGGDVVLSAGSTSYGTFSRGGKISIKSGFAKDVTATTGPIVLQTANTAAVGTSGQLILSTGSHLHRTV